MDEMVWNWGAHGASPKPYPKSNQGKKHGWNIKLSKKITVYSRLFPDVMFAGN